MTQAPSITGTQKVNQTLTAVNGHWTGPPGTSTGYVWMRCSDSNLSNCKIIDGATAVTYRLGTADQGSQMRVTLWASKGNQYDYKVSDATGSIAAANANTTPVPPPAPTPTATATATATVVAPVVAATPVPTPAATPVPTPAPTFDVAAPAATPVSNGGAVLHQTGVDKKAKMLRPTPIVRVRGRLTFNGANITMLTVRAPKGSKVTVSCVGLGCPRSKMTRTGGGTSRLSAFERVWQHGTRLTVRVSRTGYIAKVTVLTIRRGAAPLRSDRCLYPGHNRTQKCPA